MATAKENIEKEVVVLPTVPLPPPTPYEYALISDVAYSDNPPAGDSVLSKQGWKRIKTISDPNGYCGSLWIHEAKKQIVIAHRGSQNPESWITDIESVIQLKPGGFVTKAIELMREAKEFAPQGYRISTTGHSLGGFLAQVCVYWANRSDCSETFYPDMGAVVFDSPGANDFLEVIQSNIPSERERIVLNHLNVHNFCAMPTVVSTYGTPANSIWHIANSEACFLNYDVLTAHSMNEILKGFNPETGQPYYFRAMRDWPKADYSVYEEFVTSSDIKTAAKVLAIKIALDCLNGLYKYMKGKMGYAVTPTFYDQVCTREGQVSAYLQQTKAAGRRPELDEFDKRLTLSLRAHYSALPLESDSKDRMDIHHFDTRVQYFLKELTLAKPLDDPAAKLDWEKFLLEKYGQEGYALLQKCYVEKHGKKKEIVLDNYEGSVFDFQRELYTLLNRCEMVSFQSFFPRKVSELQKRIETVEEDSEKFKNQLAELKAFQNKRAEPSRHLASTVKSTVANFMPREEILADLNHKFTVSQNGGTVALIGPRGAGKTQIARYWCYAHKLKNTQNGLVLELDASSPDTLLSEYKKLGPQLGIEWEDKVSPEDIRARVQQALLRLEHDSITLLFDNAPNYDTVKPYLLPASSPNPVFSLLTSYDSTNFTSANEVKTVAVKPEFTPAEAIQYIQSTLHEKRSWKVSALEAEELAKLVYYHPLALTQALNYIVQGSTIAEFCKEYERYKPIALKRGLMGDYNESILTITSFAVEKLSAPAKNLLYFCSFLHSTDIPKSLLQAFVGKDDIEQLSRIMDELQAFSLLSRCQDISWKTTISYELHGLVQEVVREHILNHAMQRDILSGAIAIINKEYPEKNPNIEDMRRRLRLIPHMQSVLQYIDGIFSDSDRQKRDMMQLSLLLNLADAYGNSGDTLKKKNLLKRALVIRKARLGENHYLVAEILVNLSNTYRALEYPAKAKILLEQALPMLEAYYGADHAQIPPVLVMLAETYGALGIDVGTRKALLERALTIQKTLYADKDHWQMAPTLICLAHVYGELDNIDTEKSLLERAVSIEEAYYGKEHPQITAALNSLAIVYGKLNKSSTKKALLERILRIEEAHYGENHPNVVPTLVNLANVYGDLGDTNTEKSLLDRALEIEEASWFDGKNPYRMAALLISLANVHAVLNDASKQKELLERALVMQEAYYGEGHLEVAAILENLAIAYGNLRDAHMQKVVSKRALAIQRAHYDENNWRIARTEINLAMAYAALEKTSKARALLEHAVPILETYYGKNHYQTAGILEVRGTAKLIWGDKEGGCEDLQRSYHIFLQHFGENHSYTRQVKDKLEKFCPNYLSSIFSSAKAEENIDDELTTMSFNPDDARLLSRDEQRNEFPSTALGALSIIGLSSALYKKYPYKKDAENTQVAKRILTPMRRNDSMAPIPFSAFTPNTTIRSHVRHDGVSQGQPSFFTRRALSSPFFTRLPNLIGAGRVGMAAAIGVTFYGAWQMRQRHTESKLLHDTKVLTSMESKIGKGNSR